jgi:hypothetical protein
MGGRFTPKGGMAVSPEEALRYHDFHCCEGSVELMLVMIGRDPAKSNLRNLLRAMRYDCPACQAGDRPLHAQHLGDEC